MKNFLRWLKIILGSIAVAYLIMVVMLMFLEESMIFFPSQYPQGNWKPTGLSFEDANFQAADGTKLHGWYVPHEQPTAIVLFLPRQCRQHHRIASIPWNACTTSSALRC